MEIAKVVWVDRRLYLAGVYFADNSVVLVPSRTAGDWK